MLIVAIIITQEKRPASHKMCHKCQKIGYFKTEYRSGRFSQRLYRDLPLSVLLRNVRPDTFERHTASIENLENARADGVVAAIKRGVSKCGIDLDNITESKLKLVCINFDGAVVNLGVKNGVTKKLSECISNKVLVRHCVAHKLEFGVLDAV